MRVIHKPYGCDDDIVINEVDSIILTDDVISYADCNEDCDQCLGFKIPGLIFVASDMVDDTYTVICPLYIDVEAFRKSAITGVIDITENPTFVEDDYDEMIEYLSECGALKNSSEAYCYKGKGLSQIVPNAVRKIFSRREVFVGKHEENMEDEE